MVEIISSAGGVSVVRAHASAAVDEQHDALVALVLVFAHDRLAEAQRRFPVDVPQRIADAVFRQLFEVRAFAAALIGLDAELLQAAVAGEPGVARDLGEVWKYAPGLSLAQPLEQLAQSKPGSDMDIRGLQGYIAAPHGHDVVRDLGLLASLNREAYGKAVGTECRVDIVIQQAPPLERTYGLERNPDFALHSNGEGIG